MFSGLAYVMFDMHQIRQRLARQSQHTTVAVVDAAIARARTRWPTNAGREDSVDSFLRKLRQFFEVTRENVDLIDNRGHLTVGLQGNNGPGANVPAGPPPADV